MRFACAYENAGKDTSRADKPSRTETRRAQSLKLMRATKTTVAWQSLNLINDQPCWKWVSGSRMLWGLTLAAKYPDRKLASPFPAGPVLVIVKDAAAQFSLSYLSCVLNCRDKNDVCLNPRYAKRSQTLLLRLTTRPQLHVPK